MDPQLPESNPGELYAYGLIRGDGTAEVLKLTSGSTRYISTSSSGIEVEKVGSTWLAYLNDGTTETYDATGRLVQINTLGRITTLTYTGSDLTAVTGPSGMSYNCSMENGRLKRLVDPSGQFVEYSYDTCEQSHAGDASRRYDAHVSLRECWPLEPSDRHYRRTRDPLRHVQL